MDTMMILTESIDEGICRMWAFPVANKYEMAYYIMEHLDEYEAEEMFKGISWASGLRRWRYSENRTPELFLETVHKSHIDGDSESGFAIHQIDLTQPHQQAEDVTWTSDREMLELQRDHFSSRLAQIEQLMQQAEENA